jgi:hypothetical protein
VDAIFAFALPWSLQPADDSQAGKSSAPQVLEAGARVGRRSVALACSTATNGCSSTPRRRLGLQRPHSASTETDPAMLMALGLSCHVDAGFHSAACPVGLVGPLPAYAMAGIALVLCLVGGVVLEARTHGRPPRERRGPFVTRPVSPPDPTSATISARLGRAGWRPEPAARPHRPINTMLTNPTMIASATIQITTKAAPVAFRTHECRCDLAEPP